MEEPDSRFAEQLRQHPAVAGHVGHLRGNRNRLVIPLGQLPGIPQRLHILVGDGKIGVGRKGQAVPHNLSPVNQPVQLRFQFLVAVAADIPQGPGGHGPHIAKRSQIFGGIAGADHLPQHVASVTANHIGCQIRKPDIKMGFENQNDLFHHGKHLSP